MLYTIKQSPLDFNLLYLDSGESLINSTKCYFLNNNTMNLEEGIIHVNTRSIIFQPKEISESLTKLKFSESLNIKFFTVDEIISNQFEVNSQNLNENRILPTPPNNTINNLNSNYVNNLYSNTKYPMSNTNYNRKKSTNFPNNNYSNLVLNNQMNQNQNESQQRGSLISNRKASLNNGKNNYQNANNAFHNNYLNLHTANQNGNSQISPDNNNSPKYNSVNYLHNNDISKSIINNVYFDFKISNFCEIFNRFIKENIICNNNMFGVNNYNFNSNPNLASNNKKNQLYSGSNLPNNNNLNTNTNNSYMQNSNKNISNNNYNNINNNLNLKKRHTINVNFPNPNVINNFHSVNNNNNQNKMIDFNLHSTLTQNNYNVNNIFTIDLQNFFYENNLNYQYLVDLLCNINSNFNKDNQKDRDLYKSRYLFCLAKCNKTHNITRWPVTNYDITISPKKYFFVIEGEEALINNFIQDHRFVSENLNKTEDDTFSIFNEYVNKKLKYELNEIIDQEYTKKKFYGNLNSFANLENFPVNNPIENSNLNKRANTNLNNINTNNEEKMNHKKSLKNTIHPNSNNNKTDKNPITDTFKQNLILIPKNEANENFSMTILKAYFVSRIIPEGIQKGILLVYSNFMIRFKPIINNYKFAKREFSLMNSASNSDKQFLEIKLSKVESIVKYRYLFRYKAINIFLFQSQRSKIFDFETEKDFNEFYNFMLKNCKNLDKNIDDIEHHTNLWRFGSMSNFEYLMYLNTQASRSFSDLSQYPIFPWIISNYDDCEELDLTDSKNFRDLSKPIGALIQYKLERFIHNFTEMKKQNPKDQPYLYSEHYSNPAHIIYFLVRSHPQFQMKFKNGSLGPPERLFNSVRDCWSYILNINNEVKEIMPEFYTGSGDFLLNIHGLSLGETNAGSTVDNVLLPKWAKSAGHFISVCKSALESKYVSSNLHLWIDLIFGYKQQNESAVAANNLFYHMTYESALERNCDKEFKFENEFKKQAFYTQLSEYGQVPRQLFDKPHPAKNAFSIYSANYFISNSTFSQEELLVKIEHLIKDNKRLEDQCSRMEREKMEEKEMLIKSQEEIELKRKEKIKSLKDKLTEREQEYKKAIEKMIEHNNQMKMQFENYDEVKHRFYNEIIQDLESNNEKNLDENFTNNNEIFKYIKSLETSINKLKLKETQLSDSLENLSSTFKKKEEKKSKLKEQIQNITKKINKIPH